jgi:UDP-N-acetylglucosamine 2-epimerase (non-hydrolysing)
MSIEHPPQTPVMVCFGTRPEVIKLAPVVSALHAHPRLRPIVVSTAQHREMLDQALATHQIVPDIDLGLMEPGQTIDGLASRTLTTLGDVVRCEQPAAMVVQGDTTTALCAALVAFWSRVPVAHVEAGLRTWDNESPFPEEANRRGIATVAQWHFCPTEHAARNLRREGVDEATLHVTGNTVVDALQGILMQASEAHELPPRTREQRLLVTMHRRESQGAVQRALLRMLVQVAAERDVEVILPVHPNPAVHDVVIAETAGREGIHLFEPVEYATFVQLMRSSDLILTDSGGMQEEAPALGVPVLVMRDTTERPEGIEAGCVRLCGTDPANVEEALFQVLDDPLLAASMRAAPHPYGDGDAAVRIVDALARDLLPPPAPLLEAHPDPRADELTAHDLVTTGVL